MIEVKKKTDSTTKFSFESAPEGRVLRWEGATVQTKVTEDDFYMKLGGTLYALDYTPFLSISASAARGYYSEVKDATVVITLEV